MAQMPYTPTRILRHENVLYVFQPLPSPSTQFQLRSLDVSTHITASDLSYSTLSPTLPFLHDSSPRAFTPVLADGGNLTVYTGDCAQGASGGQVWTFSPRTSQGQPDGTWSQEHVSVHDGQHVSSMGANYLNGGVAFSPIVGGDAANTGAYFFGGMCPNETDTSADWQSTADYSNLMIALQPSGTDGHTVNYELNLSPSRGPPVPEAGFSMTGLPPTFSNRSDGTQTQQQNFVLLGGHTSTAFINMSQIALFSLPEQGWTFLGVQQPDTTTQNNLAARAQPSSVDPRSGHTAVLTSNGQKIVVFGGWVGDVNTPAEPQYVILDVANGYGGDGDWKWTAPTTTGLGAPDSSGLFGHGAVMLPGSVLMIIGGHMIPSSSVRQRRANPTVNTQVYFLNITSNAWSKTYSPPADIALPEPVVSGLLSTPGQKAGLGVGLGIGVAAVCGLFAFYIWYTRRLKRQREVREKQLQDLAYATHRYNIDDYSPGFDGRGGRTDALEYLAGNNGSYYFPAGTQGGQGWRASNGGDAERTGLLVEIPSPTRGLRRSLSSRPGYVPGRTRGTSQIHPIDELEEEPDEEQAHVNSTRNRQPDMVEVQSNPGAILLANAPILDPFTDVTGGGPEQKSALHPHSSSPIHQESTHMVNKSGEWLLDAVSASRRSSPTPTGRSSPNKSTSERTSSNLSERSATSDLSWTPSMAGMLRSASMRSTAILNNATHSNPFKTPNGSPTHERPRRNSETGRQSPTDPRTQSFTSIRSNGIVDIDSFRTAHSSFTHLQAEGEALLGGNPERMRPGTSSSTANTHHGTDGTNSRAATATPATSFALDTIAMARPPNTRERRRSWLGSVRRVLTRSASSAERTRSLTAAMANSEPYMDTPVAPSVTDNRKSCPAATTTPRRAASDASFWRSRRGQQDWLEDEQDPTWRRTSGDNWGAPEDVAMAERERQRQEWRERGTLLVNIDNDDQELPTPRTPIGHDHLGIHTADDRPCTPASEADWDVEAAVERRVVQVMFTVPKSKLRVVNADVDGSSILSLPRDSPREGEDVKSGSGSPTSRVKDLAGKFEQINGVRASPGASPRPSPSPSIKSMKIRPKASSASLTRQELRRSSGTKPS